MSKLLPVPFLFWIRFSTEFCPDELSFCAPSDMDPITGSHKVVNQKSDPYQQKLKCKTL